MVPRRVWAPDVEITEGVQQAVPTHHPPITEQFQPAPPVLVGQRSSGSAGPGRAWFVNRRGTSSRISLCAQSGVAGAETKGVVRRR